MEKQEYITLLTEQVRCTKARSMIADEIAKHIEDQAEAYEAKGLSPSEAVLSSIRQMGDPIEAGIALDRIHRPKTEWGILLIALTLTIFGIIIQAVLFSHADNEFIHNTYLSKTILYNLIGIGVMAGVYFIDYSILGKHPLAVYVLFLISGTIILPFLIRQYQVSILTYSMMTLFVPVYAAIVYHFRNKGMKGLCYNISLFLLYAWISVRFLFGMTALIEMTACILTLLSVAVVKGWYGKRKAAKLFFLWSFPIAIPGGILLDALLFNGKYAGLAAYQAARIRSCFSFLLSDVHGADYFTNQLRMLPGQYTLLGNGTVPDIALSSSSYNNYVVIGMFSYFGILLSITLLALLFFLLIRAFRISTQQRNRLGCLIGIGCSTSILAKTVLYLASNFGYGLFVSPSMPFLSYGLCSTLTNFAMTGLLLSVYRNTELISEKYIHAKYRFKILREKNIQP